MQTEFGRTRHQALIDVQTSVRYHALCEQLARRFRFWISFLTIILGSGAVIAYFGEHSSIAIIFNIVIAVVAALDIAWSPAEKIAAHREMGKEFLRLEMRVRQDHLNTKEIDCEISRIEIEEPVANETIVRIAQRKVLISNGFDEEANQKGLRVGFFGWIYLLMLS